MNINSNNLKHINRQMPLLLQTKECARCPIFRDGRCEGAITLESFVMQEDSVVGCREPERIDAFYKDVKRTRRVLPPPNGNDRLILPPFIPLLASGMPKDIKLAPKRLYGVSFSTILNKHGSLKYKTPESLRQGLRLPANARLALFCTVDDARIEYFWKISESKGLWQRIAALGFEFVTSASFSVYAKHPRSDQIINQAKNFLTLDDIAALNVPAIPFVFFHRESELDYLNLLGELNRRPDVRKVGILAQLRRSKYEFESLLDYMRAISGDIERTIEFVVVGVAEPTRIERILSEFPRSTIACSQPVFKGNKCGEMTLKNLKHTKNDDLNKAELIENNIEAYIDFCNTRIR